MRCGLQLSPNTRSALVQGCASRAPEISLNGAPIHAHVDTSSAAAMTACNFAVPSNRQARRVPQTTQAGHSTQQPRIVRKTSRQATYTLFERC